MQEDKLETGAGSEEKKVPEPESESEEENIVTVPGDPSKNKSPWTGPEGKVPPELTEERKGTR